MQSVSQEQGNGDAPWDVYRQPLLYSVTYSHINICMGITIAFFVGLSALFVSTYRAMREPYAVERATGLAPRFLCPFVCVT